MPDTTEARDGTTITAGKKATLILMYDTAEVEATGTVTSFEDEFGETRWEISTPDPQHPAIGFRPENVKTRLGK